MTSLTIIIQGRSDKGNLSNSENTSQPDKRLTEKAAKAKPTQVALPRLQWPQGRYKRAENVKTGTDRQNICLIWEEHRANRSDKGSKTVAAFKAHYLAYW